MEIIHVKQLIDGQPILTVRYGNDIRKFTFGEEGLWYTYPEYEKIINDILIAQLTENTETLIREGLIVNRTQLTLTN